MTGHRCPGSDCDKCAELAEYRAERAADEAEIRTRENRYEEGLYR